MQRCCWKMMLLSLHPNIIVHVENVVSLFSSPSTNSQKVKKCGGHNFLSHAIIELELEQNQFDHYTHPCVPTVYACEFLVAFIWCLCKKYESFKIPRHYFYVWYMYHCSPASKGRHVGYTTKTPDFRVLSR